VSGHVARMSEMRNVYRILFGKHENIITVHSGGIS
jgi:hypothetical protein